MFAWQATVQDEKGNAVPSPIVAVYNSDGTTLADIYDESGAVLENPFTGTAEGFVQFWALSGEYVVDGTKGTSFTEKWFITLGNELEVDSAADFLALTRIVRGVRYTSKDFCAWDTLTSGVGDFVVAGVPVRVVQPASGPVSVKAFGAVGDGVTDDTVALQRAITATQDRVWGLYFPSGTYAISQPLVVSKQVAFKGDGKPFSKIKVVSAGPIFSIISLPYGSTGVTNLTNRASLEGIQLDGSGKAGYGVIGVTNHMNFRDLWVRGTTVAGMDISYGWCNAWEEVEISYNTGDGLRLNTLGQSNAIKLSACRFFQNGGWGVIAVSSFNITLTNGTTIEFNGKGGIWAAAIRALNVDGCYFEKNGATGQYFDTPGITIHADIIINGSVPNMDGPNSLSGAFATSANISNNLVGQEGERYFIYATGAETLTVEGNSLDKLDGVLGSTLVGCYGAVSSVAPANGFFRTFRIGRNQGWDDSRIVGMAPMTAGLATYNETAQRPHSVRHLRTDYAQNVNLAETDLSKWALVVGSDGGIWRRSGVVFDQDPHAPVWEIDATGSSHIFGFSLDMADYPQNFGKLFAFSAMTKNAFSGDGGGWLYANSLATTASFVNNQDWVMQAGVFVWPETGTKNFAFRKMGAPGSAQICKPVLAEVGSDWSGLMADIGRQVVFSGAEAPTAGTWNRGDRVVKSIPVVGQPKGWVCTTSGTPGIWVSEGNL